MTDSDILALSVIFNVILMFHNWLIHKRYDKLGELFGKTIQVIVAVADGQAMLYRDKDKTIRAKEMKNETN